MNEVFIQAWDKGEYLASQRWWYRVASLVKQELRSSSPGRKKPKKKREAPVVEAIGQARYGV